ncbi:MAG: tRNA (adenosine(37)-N6)-threonylcarbamoyltransferase complex transferase subunit TsaD [Actinobacteria bacterium]|nr:tRNA (adenosine(37)-N6)-threonylcarbamoyltransferase complex transferase subunit TsaD [Actinomycetota bacterium]
MPVHERTTILGVETSCDETAAAVVRGGRDILSSVVSSQVDLHARFGGVVPEVASRAHVALITPVVAQAMVESGVTDADIDAVAVTAGPGLVGSLLVGMSAAKALGQYRIMGSTLDDAAGEAFDKVARYLGLGYPGGPAIDREAMAGDPEAIAFPRAMLDNGFDFSFSGLKTAVINHVRRHPDVSTVDVAAGFQQAVVDVLVHKARGAARAMGAKGICLSGGVAANSQLREAILDVCVADGLHGYLPSRTMCTDNAAMVAAVGWWRLMADGASPLDIGVAPGIGFPGTIG